MLETLERLIFDPISETPPYQVATNRPLEITGSRTPSPEGHGIFLVEHSYPRPEMQTTFASSRDSQGEKRFGKPKFANRKIPVKVFISEASGIGAMTNLATNPGGEVAKKFNDGTHYAVTRELGGINGISSLTGEYRDKHVFDGTANINGGSVNFTFPVAGTYTVSFFVWIPSSWDGGKIYVSGSGNYTGATEKTQVKADLSKRDQWQRIYTTIEIAAGDLVGAFVAFIESPPSSVATGVFYTDALQIESGSAATAFACGDTPGCTWNGTPNSSTSTRIGTGSDRKRFIRSLYDLQEKIEKLAEEGGTFKRVLPDGSYMVFDVEEASFVGEWEKQFNQGQQEFSFELTCRPGARLQPVTLVAHEEKTLPILKFTEPEIPGNLPALGDLLIEDAQGVNRNFVAVSVASRFLDQSANGDVFYEAENRLRLTSATLAAGSGTPSGSEANKVVSCGLFEEFTPYLSTRSSAGVYTSHIGAQKVFARVFVPTANTGTSSIRLEYAQGDLLRWKVLPTITLDTATPKGAWVLVELGVVRLNRAVVGTQRWEGRISAKSSVVGDTLQIDWLAILPVEEFYGEARALTVPSSGLGSQVARDRFSQVSGALTGKTATVGGAWAFFAGDTDDMNVVSTLDGGSISRIPASVDVSGTLNDPGTEEGVATGRYVRLGAGVAAGVSVSADIKYSGHSGVFERWGMFARAVNVNNFLLARIYQSRVVGGGGGYSYGLSVHKRVAGVWKLLGSQVAGGYGSWSPYTLTVTVLADGSGSLVASSGSSLSWTAFTWGADADLATGGALASGGYGVFHVVADNPGFPGTGVPGEGGLYMSLDNFVVREVSEQPQDAAMYANRDLRLRWDKALREAADGSGAFSDVGTYSGDRLLIPHSGREGRPVRVVVLASRNLPKIGEDVQADDIKGTLTITPRVTEVPEAA